MKKLLLLAFVSLFFLGFEASAQQIPTLDFFHGRECPHCHKEKEWFPTLKKAYPDIVINEYEVWHNRENALLAEARLKELGHKFTGVPANIIGGQEVVVGFRSEAILAALEKVYGPSETPKEDLVSEEKPSFLMRLLDTILSWFGA